MSTECPLLKVGQLAERVGKSTRALRLYEQMGLLTPHSRTETGYRMYEEDAVRQVQWIDRLQSLGVSLSELQEVLSGFSSYQTGPALMRVLHQFYQQKLAEARSRIAELESICDELEGSLEYLSDCQGCTSEAPVQQCNGCHQHHHQYNEYLVRTGSRVQVSRFEGGSSSAQQSGLIANLNGSQEDPLLVKVVVQAIAKSRG